MKRIIEFKDGIIGGNIMIDIVDILPQLKSSFTQRKSYFEYYFEPTELEITLEQLDKLSDEFRIQIDFDTITIID